LAALGSVNSLGADESGELKQTARVRALGDLFPGNVTRAMLERELPDRPKPDESPLTLDNGVSWIEKADAALQACSHAIEVTLLEKARLLHSPALRGRLEQGKNEKVISALLKAKSPEEIASQIVTMIKKGQANELVRLLNLYLQKITVQKVRMADFKPARHTFERGDVDAVAGEFKSFLLEKFKNQGKDELSVLEIE
jgi:hypothetical protein